MSLDDARIEQALRALRAPPDEHAVEHARRTVHERARGRRRRRMLASVAAGAAAVLLVVLGASLLEADRPQELDVVDDRVEQPDGGTEPEPEGVTEPEPGGGAEESDGAAEQPAGGDDPLGLGAGVTSVGVTTWSTERVLWEVDDPELAEAVVQELIAASDADAEPEPAAGDGATLVFELTDRTEVALAVDLWTGWVEGGHSIGEELAQRLGVGLDDAVSSAWEGSDLTADAGYLVSVIDDAGEPFEDPEAAIEAVVEALRERAELPEMESYRGRVVELDDAGEHALVLVQHRGIGDDALRGFDYRLVLADRPEGWIVEEAASRWLCRRGVPQPPDYACI